MPGIPNQQLGRNITSFTMVGQTVGSDGAFTDATSTALTGTLTGFETTNENTLEETGLLTSLRRNNVIVDVGTEYIIEGNLFAADSTTVGSATNPAVAQMFSKDYFKLTVVVGGITETYYGVTADLNRRFVKGVCKFRARLAMVDPGTTNPARA